MKLPAERKFDDIEIGEKTEFNRTVKAADVDAFAELTGDNNPLHMDEAFAKKTRFKGRIVHGMLVASYISTLVGMHMPGKNALFLGLDIRFISPIRIGDEIRVVGTVLSKSGSVKLITIKTEIFAGDFKVMDGKARVQALEG